jgi:hypothetical protein
MSDSIPSGPAENAAVYSALINRRITVRRDIAPSTEVSVAPRRRSVFHKARVHNISQRGIALVLRYAPPVGELIFLQVTNRLLGFTYDLAAEVRHTSLHRRGTWLVGLVFDQPLSLGELSALV